MKNSLHCAIAAMLLSGMTTFAAIPGEINYQGRLTTTEGDPVNGIVEIKVELYDASVLGNLLYEETVGSVLVTDGVYSFTFGANGVQTLQASELVFTTNGINQIFSGTLAGNPIDGTVVITDDAYYTWSEAYGSSSPDFAVTYNTTTHAIQVIYYSGVPPAGRLVEAKYDTIGVTDINSKMTADEHYLALIVDGSEPTSRTRLLAVPFALRSLSNATAEILWVQMVALKKQLQAAGIHPTGMQVVEGGSLGVLSTLGALNVETFYMARHETTLSEWQVVRAWASGQGYDISETGDGCGDNYPVNFVNWYDVLKWCNAKSEMEGLFPAYTVNGATFKTGTTIPVWNEWASGYRLPREAEWEFAARGGNLSNGYIYSGGNDLNTVAWNFVNSIGAACDLYLGRGTWPVEQKQANELGIFDMTGNVYEWCWEENGGLRMIRGGSWLGTTGDWYLSTRNIQPPLDQMGTIGFRIARNYAM